MTEFCLFLYGPNRQSPFVSGNRLSNRSTSECSWRKVSRFKGQGFGSFLSDRHLWLLGMATIEIILHKIVSRYPIW
jgi:hypothetical protein